jgi:hypothetical protein
MVNVVKGGERAPPTLTSQANFTLMMECTPESGRYHFVYSVGLLCTYRGGMRFNNKKMFVGIESNTAVKEAHFRVMERCSQLLEAHLGVLEAHCKVWGPHLDHWILTWEGWRLTSKHTSHTQGHKGSSWSIGGSPETLEAHFGAV